MYRSKKNLKSDFFKRRLVFQELKEIFGEQWKTFADDELATVITDAIQGDSRDVIMPLVLQDAK